jgi:hypothetical protein
MVAKVSTILQQKGHEVFTVAPCDTVSFLVKVLSANRIGAVPVIDQEAAWLE